MTVLPVAVALLVAPTFEEAMQLARDGACFESPVRDVSLCGRAAEDFLRSADEQPPGLGALRNAAVVFAAMGRHASAIEAYALLIERAPMDPDPDRRLWAKFAAEEIESLEPRVPTLRVELDGRDRLDIEIELDGETTMTPGTDVRLDPGVHRVIARRGAETVEEHVVELREGESRILSLSYGEAVVPPPEEVRASAPPPPSMVGGWVMLGSGVAVAGTGLGLGLGARFLRDEHCQDGLCSRRGLTRARAFADASTALTVVGSAAVVGGVVWLITASRKRRSLRGRGGSD